MAHPQFGSGPVKLSSYAKIAAMPAPNTKKTAVPVQKDKKETISEKAPPPSQHRLLRDTTVVREQAIRAVVDSMPVSIEKLTIDDTPIDSAGSEHNVDSADSYEEDQSQVSSSSLNKPQSFDTKSLASVTTFAMDDKESIRPDDSASVRAADDEHPHPGLSRNSSYQHEPDLQSNRTSRVFPSNVTLPGRRFPTLANLPRFGNLPVSPVLESQDVQMPAPPAQIISADDARDPSTAVNLPPDEKLMDALASAKDRLPLLQLEEKVLSFLADSGNPVLELPPQNSFNRLLTYKLADYYHLQHTVNDDHTSVRIFRSAPRAAPPSLAELARNVPQSTSTAPNLATMKIMRREQFGNRQMSAGNSTAPSSSVPSKATSENGIEGPSDDGLTSPAESTPNRDKSKLTREEREAQYKAARERIFADFQESVASETTSTEDQSASMSRSSSSSGKKKNRRNKPRDDSFEARSAFALTYAPSQNQYANPYNDAAMAGNYPVSPSAYDQNMYGTTPTQAFPGFDPNMQYGQMQNFNPNLMQQFNPNDWQAMQTMQMQQDAYIMYQQAMQFQQAQAMSMAQPQGMQSPSSEWYPQQSPGYMGQMYLGNNQHFEAQSIPDQRYAMQGDQFGQQSRTFSPQAIGQYDPRHAARSLFNPQTRSFVPTNGDGRTANRSGRHKGSARNNANHHTHTASTSTSSASGAKEDSLRLKYGTPASLPKKPPIASDIKHTSAPSKVNIAPPESTG